MNPTDKYSMSWKLYRKLQRKGWLRCSSIRRSLIMFRTLSDRTTATMSVLFPFVERNLSDMPSSFRMYFNANVSPESLRSTILTLPNAPLPTTRNRRKWFRLTTSDQQFARGQSGWSKLVPLSVKTTGLPLELPIGKALGTNKPQLRTRWRRQLKFF